MSWPTRPCSATGALHLNVNVSMGLRYPGHNTQGCFTSSWLCRPIVKQHRPWTTGSAASRTSPDNLAEVILTAGLRVGENGGEPPQEIVCNMFSY